MCIPDQKESSRQIHSQIEALHKEKWKLIPRCQECASPCRRNNDFNLIELSQMQNSRLKYILLSGLLYTASFSEIAECSPTPCEIVEFFYKAFFFIGYDCDEKSLIILFQELGKWQNRLYSSYFHPDTNE